MVKVTYYNLGTVSRTEEEHRCLLAMTIKIEDLLPKTRTYIALVLWNQASPTHATYAPMFNRWKTDIFVNL